MSTLRKSFLAAGVAGLLSAQVAVAAPPSSTARVDPLVALSVFGTAQSRAAVCAAGATAAAAGAAAAQVVAPAGGQPCLLPVTTTPPPAPVGAAPTYVPEARRGIGIWPILLGLAGLALVAFLLLDDDDGRGRLEPISPA